MKAVCIDISNKPKEISKKNWLELNKEYTIIGINYDVNGELGVKLKELEMNDGIHDCFRVSRFSVNLEEVLNRIHTNTRIKL